MSVDIKDHFLETPLKDPEHMRVKFKHLPDDIRTTYNLEQIKTPDDHICIKIQKPGLKWAVMLTCQHLKNCLEPYGYKPMLRTVGRWGHDTRPTTLCLCVEDFGIKCWSEDDTNHFCNAIGANFKCTTDQEGKQCCGLTLSWNYSLGHTDFAMPSYFQESQKKLNH